MKNTSYRHLGYSKKLHDVNAGKIFLVKEVFRLCEQKIVSERFHNSRNENDMNYKNSHHMKFLVSFLRRGLCWFSSRESGAF